VTWDLAASADLPARVFFAGTGASGGLHLAASDLALLIVGGLVAFGLYLASCRIWPYGPCLACRGRRGRNPGSTGRRHGRCPMCKGTGERLRVGTRILVACTSWRP